MHKFIGALPIALLIASCASLVDPGQRPMYLASGLPDSPLKTQLMSCAAHKFTPTKFSISHRGAPLGYPEHTKEGYTAAARMGAGLIECDVTFTKDLSLVCRHSQCDLHRTTNVLETPLAAQCSQPFEPATQDSDASAVCCTSDFSLDEFKQLCGRADYVDPKATSIADYLTPPSSPVAGNIDECGTLLTHSESISHIAALGAEFVPELKAPQVPMPFNGMSQQDYASKMLAEYAQQGINPDNVYPQSFNIADVLYWIENHPEYAEQVVYLDPRGRDRNFKPTLEGMQALYDQGVRILAPPMPMLLTLEDDELTPSDYAVYAKAAGLELITWTFEGRNPTSPQNWLYFNLPGFITDESKTLLVLDALATKVGIRGIFSDWPGTVTYYANCMAD